MKLSKCGDVKLTLCGAQELVGLAEVHAVYTTAPLCLYA